MKEQSEKYLPLRARMKTVLNDYTHLTLILRPQVSILSFRGKPVPREPRKAVHTAQ